MLDKKNFSKEHIQELTKKFGRDPSLLERTMYAFGLLDALARVNMPFIFKGGTCLMLLLDKPRRISTDIDIIVKPNLNVDKFLLKVSNIYPFESYEENIRKGKNSIVKRHFKFKVKSELSNKDISIILDILYANNEYSRLIEKEIKNDLLITCDTPVKVIIPSVECLLADKLTAFAPHTIGIPINVGKDMEVIKQLYDCSVLIDEVNNFREVYNTYLKVSKKEAEYRGDKTLANKALNDTFSASLCISSRGKINNNDYTNYLNGIRELRGHIFDKRFSPETIVLNAVKVMYMVLCINNNEEYIKINYLDYLNDKFINDEFLALKYLRKVNEEAYAYAILSDRLFR